MTDSLYILDQASVDLVPNDISRTIPYKDSITVATPFVFNPSTMPLALEPTTIPSPPPSTADSAASQTPNDSSQGSDSPDPDAARQDYPCKFPGCKKAYRLPGKLRYVSIQLPPRLVSRFIPHPNPSPNHT